MTDPQLSARQVQILAAMAHGLTNQTICAELGLGAGLVNANIRQIFHRLGATGRTHAVSLGYQHGLLAAPPATAPLPDAPPSPVAGPVRVAPRRRPLSDQDLTILARIADGESHAQIARRLGLAEDTVKTHMTRLRQALGARSRTHLVTLAYQRGILRLPEQTAATPPPPPARTWTIALPRGAELLNANERLHRMAEHRITQQLRKDAGWLARSAKIPRLDRAHIVTEYRPATQGRRDPANWYPAIKAAVDGLVDAGVLPDDDAAHLLGPDMRLGPIQRGAAQLLLHITELTGHIREDSL